MGRCLELAEQGLGFVAPNPMVGCLLEYQGQIVAEGFHRRYGSEHAEVDALKGVEDPKILAQGTLYVSLEPCSHFGKTPPCAEFLVRKGIRKVVVATLDPNPKVSGEGVAYLKNNGVEVEVGMLSTEAKELNKRFFTFHENARPYVILKWAETADGFIAKEDYTSKWISSEASRKLVHRWRAEESAVLVGTHTVIHDNPSLTARGESNVDGSRDPIRIVIDRSLKIPTSFSIFDERAKTILYNEIENYDYPPATLVKIDFSRDIIPQILSDLHSRKVLSVIVEGGAATLSSFLAVDTWDEARVFVGRQNFSKGIKAPKLSIKPNCEKTIDVDTLRTFRNMKV